MAKYLLMNQNKAGLFEENHESARVVKERFLNLIEAYGEDRIMDMWSSYGVDIILNPSFDEDGTFDPDWKGYDVFTGQMYFQFGEEGLDLFLEQ